VANKSLPLAYECNTVRTWTDTRQHLALWTNIDLYVHALQGIADLTEAAASLRFCSAVLGFIMRPQIRLVVSPCG